MKTKSPKITRYVPKKIAKKKYKVIRKKNSYMNFE